jgi:hypothetical protein
MMVLVAPSKTMGHDFSWQPDGAICAPVGTTQATKMLEEGVRDLIEAVQRGVRVLVERLPDQRPAS